MTPPRRHRRTSIATAGLAALLCLGPNLPGRGARAASLNGSSTGLGLVTNVQQNGASPPSATITSGAAGSGLAYVITPHANRSIIDWNSFSLSPADSVNFAFGARDDIAVNRIASGAANIGGVLTSTVANAYGGNVWFIAPGGVAFGANAVVDVGGLLATSSPFSLSDAAFLASTDSTNFTFASAAPSSSVSVASGAALRVHGGLLALVAPTISTQAGASVSGDAGGTQVLYAAAEAFEIQLSPSAAADLDLIALVVDTPSGASAPLTLGATTSAGQVYVAGAASTADAVISGSGDLVATQASAVGGDIVLSSGGLAAAAGSMQATAPAASTSSSAITTTLGAVSADHAVSLNAAGALTVGQVSGASGVTITAGGALNITGALTSAGGPTSLTTTAGDIVIGGAVNAAGQALTLTSAAAVTQTSGAITTASLAGSSVGAASLTGAGNAVAALGPFSAGSGFSLADSRALNITGTLTSAGGPTSLTTTAGDIVIGGAINAAGQALTLTSAGAVTQTSGAITAASLAGSSVGAASLAGAGNAVAALGPFSAGSGFSLADSRALNITGTLTSAGGPTSLTTTAGDIVIGGAINAAGQALTLTSAGAVTQTGGAITAASLAGSSVGAASLTGAGNAVAALGPFSAGSGFSLADSRALNITGTLTSAGGPTSLTTTAGDIVIGGALNAAGQALTLTSAGAVTQTGGAITARAVELSASGGVNLAGLIQAGDALTVSALGGAVVQTGTATTGGMTRYTAAGAIVLDGGAIVSGGDINLVSQSGPLQIITPVGAPTAFTNLTTPGVTSLTAANGSIMIGETPFVSAVNGFLAGHSGADLNVSRGVPAVAQPAALGRVFVQTGTLHLTASGGVVQQNTTPFPGESAGMVITNPVRSAAAVLISGAGGKAPSVVDLFLTLVNSGGATLTGKVVATSGEVDLAITPTNNYRVNGCVIGQAGVCTVLSDAIVDVQPANLTGDLRLESLPNASISDPTITGTGNEEIWRHGL